MGNKHSVQPSEVEGAANIDDNQRLRAMKDDLFNPILNDEINRVYNAMLNDVKQDKTAENLHTYIRLYKSQKYMQHKFDKRAMQELFNIAHESIVFTDHNGVNENGTLINKPREYFRWLRVAILKNKCHASKFMHTLLYDWLHRDKNGLDSLKKLLKSSNEQSKSNKINATCMQLLVEFYDPSDITLLADMNMYMERELEDKNSAHTEAIENMLKTIKSKMPQNTTSD